MPSELGKRYICEVCGTESLCTKTGDGVVECCGKPIELQQPKVLPASD